MDKKIMSTSIDPSKILNELRQRDDSDLEVFQGLLNHSSKKFVGSWEPVLLKIFELITSNEIIRSQQSLLASHAFFKISAEILLNFDIKSKFQEILKLEINEIILLNQTFKIVDYGCFKLTIIHGYLLVDSENIFSLENFLLSFEILQHYCMSYTRYAHFAFKLLEVWLKRSIVLKLWYNNDYDIEKKLETIIFSNWDNCISDVTKINAHQIFPLYLNIMEDKYDRFLEYAFQVCNRNLSWRSTTKFIILSVICKVWNGFPKFTNWEIEIIIQSLTKNQLKHASTKLYIALLAKMNHIEWSEFFMNSLCSISKVWEQEKNISALQLLWDLWMIPTLNKFKNQDGVVSILWLKFCEDEMIVCQSYLVKISTELNISWNQLNSYVDEKNSTKNSSNRIELYHWKIDRNYRVLLLMIDAQECVRLNTFEYYCKSNDFSFTHELDDNYQIIQQFLYYNANANSVKLRKGIFDNFKILFDRISKSAWVVESFNFICWLYKFILYCFEPGSCYQRKIIGLKLYEIILITGDKQLVYEHNKNGEDTSIKKIMQNAWEFHDKNTLLNLLRLCLDPVEEIRQVASKIIRNYLDMRILSTEERTAIDLKIREMNKSPKFYETAAGVKLLILVSQVPDISKLFDYSNPQCFYEYLLKNAEDSLDLIKKDLLKALTQDSNFNASLIAILQSGSEKDPSHFFLDVSEDYIIRLLNLLEEATIFFLSALSPKSSNIDYSSSFAEMAVAIEDIIKNSEATEESNNITISPAHQVIISSIWMALKTISELSAKISTLPLKLNEISRSLDLIVSILMKCRHKGAIEAAGYALGESMRCLAHKNEFKHLFDAYLNKLLNLDSKDKINLTRRGAGLSIMFLKMMVNDKKRRIVHIALRRILNSLHDSQQNIKELNECIDASQDLPIARLLHFLRSIVVDKSLLEDLVSYIEEISLISINHLQSSEWAIRNASLQLLGAVIPRIVGQTGENELELGTGYLINHFVTHYPTLAKLVIEKLDHESDFKTTNILVPLLTLLSKMSVGGCDFTDYSSKEYICQLKQRLYLLFGHSVDHVRFLAAKAYSVLIPIYSLTTELFDRNMEHVESKGNNYIHGNLLTQINLQQIAKYSEIWIDKKSCSINNYYAEIAKDFIFNAKLNRCYCLFDYWNRNIESKKPLSNIIETTFLESVINFPLSLEEDFQKFSFMAKPYYLQTLIENSKINNRIGFSKLIHQLLKLSCLIVNIDSEYVEYIFGDFLLKYKRCEDVENYFVKHLNNVQSFETSHRDKLIFKLLEDSFNNCQNNQIINNIKIIIDTIKINEDYRKAIWTDNNSLGNEISRLSNYLLEKFKCRKIHQLAHMLTVLDSSQCYESYGDKGSCDRCKPHSKVINDIVRAIHDPNDQKRIWSIDCLINFNFRKISHQFRQRVMESLIILISDENIEIRILLREKMLERGKELEKIIDCIIGNHDKPDMLDLCYGAEDAYPQPFDLQRSKNLEFHLHQVIKAAIIGHFFCLRMISYCPSSQCSSQCILNFIDNIIENKKNLQVCENTLESPFDHDETYSENTKFMNIYYSLLFDITKNLIRQGSYIKGYTDFYTIIERGNQFYTDYVRKTSKENNSLDVVTVLNIKINDYLNYKKKCLSQFIRVYCTRSRKSEKELKNDQRYKKNKNKNENKNKNK